MEKQTAIEVGIDRYCRCAVGARGDSEEVCLLALVSIHYYDLLL